VNDSQCPGYDIKLLETRKYDTKTRRYASKLLETGKWDHTQINSWAPQDDLDIGLAEKDLTVAIITMLIN
jgi:hypothetical protein